MSTVGQAPICVMRFDKLLYVYYVKNSCMCYVGQTAVQG